MERKDVKQDNMNEFADDKNKANIFPEKKDSKEPKSKDIGFKNKECSVIQYNENLKILDVNFDGYGIRIKDVPNVGGSTVTIKYRGEIGKPNFCCKM